MNVNNIVGFKFHEIKSWLLSRLFHVLVLTETKIDKSLLKSKFAIGGYRFTRLDRSSRGVSVSGNYNFERERDFVFLWCWYAGFARETERDMVFQ